MKTWKTEDSNCPAQTKSSAARQHYSTADAPVRMNPPTGYMVLWFAAVAGYLPRSHSAPTLNNINSNVRAPITMAFPAVLKFGRLVDDFILQGFNFSGPHEMVTVPFFSSPTLDFTNTLPSPNLPPNQRFEFSRPSLTINN